MYVNYSHAHNIYLHFFEKKLAKVRFVGCRADLGPEFECRRDVVFVDLAVRTKVISYTTL